MTQATENPPQREKTSSPPAGEQGRASTGEDLTLADMMKILDVAHSLQADRETVNEQLSIEKQKANMRERLLASRDITGAGYNDAELDAAIDLYYDNLHRYQEPKGMNAMLAHAYIRRGPIGATVGGVAAASALVWGLFLNPYSPWSNYGSVTKQLSREREAIVRVERDLQAIPNAVSQHPELGKLKSNADTYEQARDVTKLRESRQEIEKIASAAREAQATAKSAAEDLAKIHKLLASAQSVAVEPGVKEQLATLSKQADELAGSQNLQRLGQLRESVADIESALQQDYEIRVVWRNQQSALQRKSKQNPSGAPSSYLVVQALDKAGKPVSVTVPDVEDGKPERATKWAEMVPTEVYERIKKDKQSDGVLNDDLYAVKKKGYLGMDIMMKGADGKPVARERQLTHIDEKLKQRK
jgi:tetratricopeptide (TPR) repeat protein